MNFLKSEYKFIVKALLVIFVICVVWYEFKNFSFHPAPPQATIQQVNYLEISKALELMGFKKEQKEIQYITREIERTSQGQPTVIMQGYTEAEVQAKIQAAIKKDKPTFVLQNPTGQYSANYFAVHLEKDFKVKAGFTFGGYTSVNAEVDYKRLSLIGHKSLDKQKSDSVSLMFTLIQK